ncbi:hypothetical protein BDC45DRAFT_533886 [Circinella umbellata]|nr:hypothetical protein BDC45DRAFT_533886 [Circinella umbellata]
MFIHLIRCLISCKSVDVSITSIPIKSLLPIAKKIKEEQDISVSLLAKTTSPGVVCMVEHRTPSGSTLLSDKHVSVVALLAKITSPGVVCMVEHHTPSGSTLLSDKHVSVVQEFVSKIHRRRTLNRQHAMTHVYSKCAPGLAPLAKTTSPGVVCMVEHHTPSGSTLLSDKHVSVVQGFVSKIHRRRTLNRQHAMTHVYSKCAPGLALLAKTTSPGVVCMVEHHTPSGSTLLSDKHVSVVQGFVSKIHRRRTLNRQHAMTHVYSKCAPGFALLAKTTSPGVVCMVEHHTPSGSTLLSDKHVSVVQGFVSKIHRRRTLNRQHAMTHVYSKCEPRLYKKKKKIVSKSLALEKITTQ